MAVLLREPARRAGREAETHVTHRGIAPGVSGDIVARTGAELTSDWLLAIVGTR